MACPVFIVNTRDYQRVWGVLSFFSLTLHHSSEQKEDVIMTYLPDVVMGSDCVELATGNVSLFGLLSLRSESVKIQSGASSLLHHLPCC